MDLKNLVNMAKNVIDKDGDGFEISDLTQLLNFKGGTENLLSGEFLGKFTQFGSLDGLLQKVGVSKPEELVNVDKGKLDDVINKNSEFGNLTEMLAKAKSFLPGEK